MKENLDILISFDTTGSMSSCIGQVRKHVKDTCNYLFDLVPNLRIGLIGHGDYCDGAKVITTMDFTTDRNKVVDYITNKIPNTRGGDAPECYELVLHTARGMSWTSGKNKAFVLIGDEIPHEKRDNPKGLDWKNEAGLLSESGVKILPVQCLGNSRADKFYDHLASLSKMEKLELEQFTEITDILIAVALTQSDNVDILIKHLEQKGATQNVFQNVDVLSGKKKRKRKVSEHGLHAVHPSRFQILSVEEDSPIMDFVRENDLHFKTGRGFYELTKPVKVQSYKEVVIQDKSTGEMFSGEKAREILGIPVGSTAKVRPVSLEKYRGFIQSTSNNRKLLGGTKFLYELDRK